MVQVGVVQDERRIAIEAIATLAHFKADLYQYVLAPAGLPLPVYQRILRRKDILGRPLTKRAMAPLILDESAQQRGQPSLARRIVELAAAWHRMDLPEDATAARAAILMARGFLSSAAEIEIERERRRLAEVAAVTDERRLEYERQCELLLADFDDLEQSSNAQQRGYRLQDLLSRLLDLHDIPVFRSFTRNEGGEQIDGAFRLDGIYVLVECRWRSQPADIRQTDGLLGQVQRSGPQTLGLFLSIQGWSEKVVPLLKQNATKRLMLMNGYELRRVLADPLDLQALFRAKLAALNLRAEPFLSVGDFLRGT